MLIIIGRVTWKRLLVAANAEYSRLVDEISSNIFTINNNGNAETQSHDLTFVALRECHHFVISNSC